MRPTFLFLALLAASAGAAAGAAAQPAPPLDFGSADDVFERGSGRVESEGGSVSVFAGGAYLPDTWRGAVRGRVELSRGPVSASVAATLHPALGGLYGPEADEAYDALRAVEYVRLNPAPGRPLYARLGPTEHVTLGVGALAREYRTTTAWDERTLGVEAAVATRRFAAGVFADDVRLTGVVGGQAEVRTPLRVGPLSGLRVGAGVVHDRGLPASGDSSLTGVELTLHGDLVSARFAPDAPLGLSPFLTAAQYVGKGRTVGAGVDLDAFRFSPTLRARARAAVFVSSARFVPGHVNPFYAISNADERIVAGLASGDADAATGALVGAPLDSLRGGVDVVLDLRFLAFGRFEASQHIRAHLGPDRASAYGIRLAARLPRRARAELMLERQGFRGVFGFVRNLGDENALVLDIAAPVGRSLQAFVRSRYGYRRLRGEPAPAQAGGVPDNRFVAERRFEPLVGVRLGLR